MQTNDDNKGGNGAHPACAPCKHQRKKCTGDCVLAPYFPADKNDEFQSVRRTCGVKMLTKMIERVGLPEDRKSLAEAVIWIASCWDEDPVLGALGRYRRLQQRNEELERDNATLREILHQIAQNQPLQFNINGQVCKPPGSGIANGWKSPNAPSFPTQNNIRSNGIGIGRGGGGGGLANNSVVNYNHSSNGYMALHQIPYGVVPPQNYMQGQQEKAKKENNAAALAVTLQQQQQLQLQQQQPQRQHSVNGYNPHQFYHPGQLNLINGKIMDETQWECRP